MKFSVAVPLVALLTALILALLTLLAGIKHSFMPDTFIVRISERSPIRSGDQRSNGTVPGGPNKVNQTALRTRQPRNDFTAPEKGKSSSSAYHTGSSTITSSSTQPTSPTRSSVMTNTTFELEYWSVVEWEGRSQLGSIDSVQGTFIIKGTFSTTGSDRDMGGNDHVPDPGNSTNTTTPDPRNSTSDTTAKNCTMHFLTNCQWNNDNAQNCSKPWDFKSGITLPKDIPSGGGHRSRFPFLLRRDAANANNSEPRDKYEEMIEKVRKTRHGFSNVHLTGCVLIGLSFLCTAASFFILPALGKWISIGSLALATLATIFLLTSSIFTAVLAKKATDFCENEENASLRCKAHSGTKLQALV